MGTSNAFRKTTAYSIFLDELRAQLDTMEEIQLKGDWTQDEYEQLKEQCHKLRGSAGLFGHDDVGGIAYQLEQKLVAVMKPFKNFKNDFKKFEETIREVVSDDRGLDE